MTIPRSRRNRLKVQGSIIQGIAVFAIVCAFEALFGSPSPYLAPVVAPMFAIGSFIRLGRRLNTIERADRTCTLWELFRFDLTGYLPQ